MTNTEVKRFLVQHSTTTWRSHRWRSLSRFLQSLNHSQSWKKMYVYHTRPLIEERTDKHKHPHKLNRTEYNQTTDHINITMCAQTVCLHSDSLLQLFSNTLDRSLSHTCYSTYAMHAALSHTAPIMLTQTDHIMSPLVMQPLPSVPLFIPLKLCLSFR